MVPMFGGVSCMLRLVRLQFNVEITELDTAAVCF